jgi:glycosyltransferase involved in cell wall biosynthesis
VSSAPRASSIRPRVLFEQYVIPRYRVPFFAALAQHVDLLVVASEDRKVTGVCDVRDGLPFRSVRLAEQPGTLFHPELGRCLREHSTQVWISYDHDVRKYADGAPIARLAREQAVRTLHMGCDGYTVRDLAAYRRELTTPWRRPRAHVAWRRQRRHLRGLDGFALYSSHSARFLEAVYDVPRERITVAHNAVDTHVIEEVRRQREASGASRDPLRVAFVGRMTSGKGIETLLTAFCEVTRRLPGSSLVLVGDGDAREANMVLAAELGLENVDFRGAVYDDRELAQILCECSLFVLPGLGGLALNTAMAAGLAVICTDGDGTELDLVQEGVNGWRLEAGNADALAAAVTHALAEPGRLWAFGAASATLIEHDFSLSAMVAAYRERIWRLLSEEPA